MDIFLTHRIYAKNARHYARRVQTRWKIAIVAINPLIE